MLVSDFRQSRRLRRLEVQFQRFLEIGESFGLALALTSQIEFQPLGDVPLSLSPNGRREWSLQDCIVSQASVLRTVTSAIPGC